MFTYSFKCELKNKRTPQYENIFHEYLIKKIDILTDWLAVWLSGYAGCLTVPFAIGECNSLIINTIDFLCLINYQIYKKKRQRLSIRDVIKNLLLFSNFVRYVCSIFEFFFLFCYIDTCVSYMQIYIHNGPLQRFSQGYWPSFSHHLCCMC